MSHELVRTRGGAPGHPRPWRRARSCTRAWARCVEARAAVRAAVAPGRAAGRHATGTAGAVRRGPGRGLERRWPPGRVGTGAGHGRPAGDRQLRARPGRAGAGADRAGGDFGLQGAARRGGPGAVATRAARDRAHHAGGWRHGDLLPALARRAEPGRHRVLGSRSRRGPTPRCGRWPPSGCCAQAAGARCTLFTYSASTAVRVALLLAGWAVGVGDADRRQGRRPPPRPFGRDDLVRPLDRQWLARLRPSGRTAAIRRAGGRPLAGGGRPPVRRLSVPKIGIKLSVYRTHARDHTSPLADLPLVRSLMAASAVQ